MKKEKVAIASSTKISAKAATKPKVRARSSVASAAIADDSAWRRRWFDSDRSAASGRATPVSRYNAKMAKPITPTLDSILKTKS